ncbi:hypothetical protein NECID01_0454 [Nematocida sp. AWRm77]|nr:hypothetical protein NECID01_0454 [Nematocida sp. AWRm77]
MKRLCNKQQTVSLPEERKEEAGIPWQYIEGFSGWFVYKLSKYIPMGIYPINTNLCTGRKVTAKYRVDLSALPAEVGVLKLVGIGSVKGRAEDSSIKSIIVKETEMVSELWEVVGKCKIVWLENVEIRKYKNEYFQSALSIDIVGSTVEQIKHCIVDMLDARRRRIRIASKDMLVFWDEYKGCTLAVKYSDVLGVMKKIPLIKALYLDSIDVTIQIIQELSKHPVAEVKFIKCHVLPLKLYDLVSLCKKTLKTVEFRSTFVSPAVVEHMEKSHIKVVISKCENAQP